MAQALTPLPNSPLIRDDPRADKMWRDALAQVFTRVYASSQIAHNSLDGLQGGSAAQRYHLTQAQHGSVTSFFGSVFGTSSVLYTNASGTVSTESAFTYDETLNRLSVSTLGVSRALVTSMVAAAISTLMISTSAIGVTSLAVGLAVFTQASGLLAVSSAFAYNSSTSILSVGGINTATTSLPVTGIYRPFVNVLGVAGGRLAVLTTNGMLSNGLGSSTMVAFAGGAARIQTYGTGEDDASIGAAVFANAAVNSPWLALVKSRGIHVSSYVIVQDGDTLGTMAVSGSDGADTALGASIVARVDGTASTNAMPSMWEIRCSPTSSQVPSTYAVVRSDGRIYGTALHNNTGSLTGTANQYIASGTYTPTASSIANVSSTITTFQAQWMRVANVVTVSGRLQWQATAPATLTRIGLTLPIASNFAAVEDCAGTAAATGIAAQSAGIQAEATNDQAEFRYIAGDITAQPHQYSYTYEVR